MRISDWSSDVCSSDLAVTGPVERPSRLGVGVLGSRTNRLADLASGAVVDIPQELVDPARCRIWEHHNRDYSALNEDRCADLIETIVAQGKQEFPAIVRRVTGDPDHDYERSEEHTSELPSLMRSSYSVFCVKQKKMKRK